MGVALALLAPLAPQATHAAQPTAPAEAARASSKPVEVIGKRTETQQVFANPDGTFTLSVSNEPVRTKDGSPIDTTLSKHADGSIGPKATTEHIRFSAGGDGPMARLSRDGKQLSFGWPGKLPEPVLNGSTATYAEVLPGVDLRLTATVSGFTHVIVVKNRAAAANPRLSRVRFAMQTTGLHVEKESDGSLSALDDRGEVVFQAPPALMWDSGDEADVVKRPAPPRFAAMGVEVGPGELALVPDPDLLTGPKTAFPLHLDPYWGGDKTTGSRTLWGHCKGSTAPYSPQGRVEVGHVVADAKCGGPYYRQHMVNRGLFEMDTSGVAGKQILGATFRLQQESSVSCAVKYLDLHHTIWADNWDGHREMSGEPLLVRTPLATCHTGGVDFSGDNVRNAVAAVAGGKVVFGLKAMDENDGSQGNWPWWNFLSTAQIDITYNTVPGLPAQLHVVDDLNRAAGCATGPSRPHVGATRNIYMKHQVSDADSGDTLTGRAIIFQNDGVPREHQLWFSEQGGIGSGGWAQVRFDAGEFRHDDQLIDVADWDNDGHLDAIVRRNQSHEIMMYPGSLNGFLPAVRLASWWEGMTFAGVGDYDRDGNEDIIAYYPWGDLYLFTGPGTRGPMGGNKFLLTQGASGFIPAGVGDWDDDGFPDLIMSDPQGLLWMYPGNGQRTTFAERHLIGNGGWESYRFAGVADYDLDGFADLLAIDPGGKLWLYPGEGKRQGHGDRFEISWGWAGNFKPRIAADLTGDGRPDLLTKVDYDTTMWTYRGTASRTVQIPDRVPAGTVGHIADGDTVSWDADASDGHAWTGRTGRCEFTLDLTPPANAPGVASTSYPPDDNNWYGGVGKAGTFTFTPVGATDVVKYYYGWTDTPSTPVDAPSGTVSVSLAPPKDGPLTLFVKAADQAGNLSPAYPYSFNVATNHPPSGWWKLDHLTGGAADESRFGHTLTPIGGPGVIPGVIGNGVALNGTNQALVANAPVLNTARSFTVSARVKLTEARNATVLSVDGNRSSAFQLKTYDWNRPAEWIFTTGQSDVDYVVPDIAWSGRSAKIGEWEYLTAVYDAEAAKIRIYLEGQLLGEANRATPWPAAGPLAIGRGKSDGNFADFFPGAVDDVRVWQRALTDAEIRAVLDRKPDPVRWWNFDTTQNLGPAAAPIKLEGNASLGDKYLALDGNGDFASAGPAVHTNQSFTVSAWAWLGEDREATVVSQHGVNRSAFTVMYLPYCAETGGPCWRFEMSKADGTEVGLTVPVETDGDDENSPLSQWQHVTAVYDAAASEMRIYLNGEWKNSQRMENTWDAQHQTLIGVAEEGGHWLGRLDDVRFFETSLSQAEITALFQTPRS